MDDVLLDRPGEGWRHAEWYAPPQAGEDHPIIAEAVALVGEARIEQHLFFRKASTSRRALQLWAAQEAVVSGPFSQLVLRITARVRNVHVRSMLIQVAYGEHNAMRGLVASKSHPWLLDRLRASVGVDAADITVLPETRLFLDRLEAECERSLLAACGALGVGNELLILPEYRAVKDCFAACWPDRDYRAFLDSNISEDETHWRLMVHAGQALIAAGAEPKDFFDGARSALEARVEYYDALGSRV